VNVRGYTKEWVSFGRSDHGVGVCELHASAVPPGAALL
jgi:hypothetical protein